MKIKSIRDVAEFIADWSGSTDTFPGGPTPLQMSTPEPIRVLDELLGGFWGEPPYLIKPYESDYNRDRGLFGVQDFIISPRPAFRPELDDNNTADTSSKEHVTLFMEENQGVYVLGYSKDHKLMVSGEWIWNGEPEAHENWSPFPADIEDALIHTVLMNFYWYYYTDENSEDINYKDLVSQDEYILLWSHPGWAAFTGFYTNRDRTIFTAGGQLIKRLR